MKVYLNTQTMKLLRFIISFISITSCISSYYDEIGYRPCWSGLIQFPVTVCETIRTAVVLYKYVLSEITNDILKNNLIFHTQSSVPE